MNNQKSFPIINIDNKREYITIEFDVKAEYYPEYNIKFIFCNKNWEPYNSAFLENYGYNIYPNLWYEELPITVEGADLHFKEKFPNDYVTFPFPGRWKFFITDVYNEVIFAEGRFFVFKNDVKLKIKKSKFLEKSLNDPIERLRKDLVEVEFELPDTLYREKIEHIEIIQNRRFDDRKRISTDDQSEDKWYEWDGRNHFEFFTNSFYPSNEYRTINMRDTNVYFREMEYSNRDRIETSRYFDAGRKDNNGASKFSNPYKRYSDYINVYFQFNEVLEESEQVYLTGSFNDWKILPELKMEYENNVSSKVISLKRGVYDYQYVSVKEDIDGKLIQDWIKFEGNFWSTENEYRAFLFYNTTELGGYEKLIGYVELKQE